MSLLQIRAHRYGVGGYAAVFNAIHAGALFRPGAFDAVLRRGRLYLLLNHAEAGIAPSLASMTTGTLRAEEDSHGLWFEAMLSDPSIYAAVVSGAATGVSTGASGGFDHVYSVRGVQEIVRSGAWELSILTSPRRPACPSTWVMTNAAARARREAGGVAP
jgi:HK97 family phage prohead protease